MEPSTLDYLRKMAMFPVLQKRKATAFQTKNETVIQVNRKFFRVSVTKMLDQLNMNFFHEDGNKYGGK